MQGLYLPLKLSLTGFVLASLLLEVSSADYDSNLQSTKDGVCWTARKFTDGFEYMVDKLKEAVIDKKIPSETKSLSPVAEGNGHFQQGLKHILIHGQKSFKAWQQLEKFIEDAVKSPMMAYSVFGISSIYLIDGLCLTSEIRQRVEHQTPLKHRLNEIRDKFHSEETLIEAFYRRSRTGSNADNGQSDLKLLKNVQGLVSDVKCVIQDIEMELSNVNFQKRKAENHATYSAGVGAVAGCILFGTTATVMTGGLAAAPSFLYGMALVGGVVGGIAGNVIGNSNQRVAAQLLRELDTLKWDAEKLYSKIDEAHFKIRAILQVSL